MTEHGESPKAAGTGRHEETEIEGAFKASAFRDVWWNEDDPIEVTREMVEAGLDRDAELQEAYLPDWRVAEVYRAMVRARATKDSKAAPDDGASDKD